MGRILLLFGAGYLLWEWYQKNQMTLPGGVNPGTTPGTAPGTTPGTGTGTTPVDPPANTDGTVADGTFSYFNFILMGDPVYLARVPQGPWNLPADYVYAQAAAGNANAIHATDRNNVLFNVDQWNFYRVVAGKAPVDAALMTQLTAEGNDPMLASEYRRRIEGAGLTGLFSNLGMGGVWA